MPCLVLRASNQSTGRRYSGEYKIIFLSQKNNITYLHRTEVTKDYGLPYRVEAVSLAPSGNRALDWQYSVYYPVVTKPVVFEMRSEGLPIGVTREKTLEIIEAGLQRQTANELGLEKINRAKVAINALLHARRAPDEIRQRIGEPY